MTMTRFAFASFGLRRFALPMLSIPLLLALSGDPSSAKAAGPLPVSGPAPGRAVETVTPRATVVSSAHYQLALGLTCGSSTVTGPVCTGDFPVVAPGRRLKLTRISCHMRSSTYATFASGKIVLNPSGQLVQYLPADYSTDFGYHMLNSAVDVQVAARQHLSVSLVLASGGQALEAACTAHGTLERLG
jgi:hypothetical protein